MANELTISYPTGNTLYSVILNSVGQIYSTATTAFEVPQNANWANYDIAMAEAGATGIYRGTMPTVAAGAYSFVVRDQAGGAPATTDPPVGAENFNWDGSAVVDATAFATAVWNRLTSAMTTVGSIGKLLVDYVNVAVSTRTTLGAGAITFTYTLTSSVDGSPIADADVWVTTDTAGSNVVASGRTNSSGVVVFQLDAGTRYFWRQKDGWNFTNPDTEVVS